VPDSILECLPKEQEKPLPTLVEPRKSIYVDSLTAFPLKLYMEFENAGVSAKRRGQHTLRESRTTDGMLVQRLLVDQYSGERRSV